MQTNKIMIQVIRLKIMCNITWLIISFKYLLMKISFKIIDEPDKKRETTSIHLF